MARILVVDDHPVTREPLVRLLRLEGYDAVAASNGEEALAALEPNTPGATSGADLVILDLMMPKMDGVHFLRVMRQDPRWRGLPVLLLTAVLEGSRLAQARELDVCNVIQKAKFGLPQLFDAIRACLDAPPNACGNGSTTHAA